MRKGQLGKYAAAIKPAAVLDNTSATATAVDTLGATYAEFLVQLGATDIACTAFKLQECATSGGSYADITGATFDGGANAFGGTLALPSATDDGQVCVFQVDLANRLRYLKLVVTFGDGTTGGYVAASCRLSGLSTQPGTDVATADGGVCRV